MLSKITTALLIVGLAVGGLGATAMAGGGDVKELHKLLVAFYDCPAGTVNPVSGQVNDCINGRTASQNEDGLGNEVVTVGDAISAGLRSSLSCSSRPLKYGFS